MTLTKTFAAIAAEFPGPNNAGLRKEIRESVMGGSFPSGRKWALTAGGRASLAAIRKVWENETATAAVPE